MNSYKAAISKLNNNSLKIGSEIVSIKDALNRISSKEVTVSYTHLTLPTITGV